MPRYSVALMFLRLLRTVAGQSPRPDALAITHNGSDFTTDARVFLLSFFALALGAISSGAAFLLLGLINIVTNLAFFLRLSAVSATPQGNHYGLWVIVIPVLGAVIVGLLARFGSERIRGHGIPEAIEAILLGRSRIEPKVAILKPLSAAISIGTGGPFGAEGPIIMTGGALGSILAQRFHLTAGERKTLLVAGAAAGMTAIFASPIAAVLLAIELLLFEWKPRSFIPVTVAAVTASVLRVPLFGAAPVFAVTPHDALTGMALPVAACLGLLVGFASIGVTTLVYAWEDAFQKLPIHWMWWPALGAVVVGVGGAIDPRVLGVGYETIHSILRGELTGSPVLGLMLLKALVWSVALGSGTSGGVLAPLLMIGGALGAWIAPHLLIGDAGIWATIGMGAMMGGTMRCPLTATVFAAELTHDFQLLPALLIGSGAAYCVAVLLMRRSILTEKLSRRGQHIACEYSVDPFERVRVGDVMDHNPPCVREEVTLAELACLTEPGASPLALRQATLITDQHGRAVGLLSRGDLVRELRRDPSGAVTVGQAGRKSLEVTFPDESLRAALSRMLVRNIGRLPVVERSSPSRVVGYLGRAAILSAYARLTEEERLRQRG